MTDHFDHGHNSMRIVGDIRLHRLAVVDMELVSEVGLLGRRNILRLHTRNTPPFDVPKGHCEHEAGLHVGQDVQIIDNWQCAILRQSDTFDRIRTSFANLSKLSLSQAFRCCCK